MSGGGTTHPSTHLPALTSPVGKYEAKCYYDMTQTPSSIYGSGADKLTTTLISLKDHKPLKRLQTTLGDQSLSWDPFFTDLTPQLHVEQSKSMAMRLQPHT